MIIYGFHFVQNSPRLQTIIAETTQALPGWWLPAFTVSFSKSFSAALPVQPVSDMLKQIRLDRGIGKLWRKIIRPFHLTVFHFRRQNIHFPWYFAGITENLSFSSAISFCWKNFTVIIAVPLFPSTKDAGPSHTACWLRFYEADTGQSLGLIYWCNDAYSPLPFYEIIWS